ncbi:pseudouridine synthase [Anaerosacchariphilus polymeriproducens]|uniref:Pseudouridine synthase n=1 Tax=Anaerosacchariphilus polymeriproducens TaxID=1812858 RepID=A0A371AU01_9FIRM|nr:pseudouridine synthase [Anaerosacchariphilus polymeriproducens]RDU23022.1 rRNA pseudouridine synthase [Anaerosacchariphilus polymeriproducens]
MLRLDKFLSNMKAGSRTEVKNWIRKGMVSVNDVIVKKPETKIDANAKVLLNNREISFVFCEYYMLNKPAGVISATSDFKQPTVVDLIESRQRTDLFPVGRLDKDTEGLLLITNDGVLAHNLLSPKKHVNKTYYAKIDGMITQEDKETFSKGIKIGENEMTRPAELEILTTGSISEILLTIHEGKFHQVKRMFHSIQKDVLYLKRISMGPIKLDENLAVGEYRLLTQEEIDLLKGVSN